MPGTDRRSGSNHPVAVAPAPRGHDLPAEEGLATALSAFLAQLHDFEQEPLDEGPATTTIAAPGRGAQQELPTRGADGTGALSSGDATVRRLAKRSGPTGLGVNPGLNRVVPPSNDMTKAVVPGHRPAPMKVLPPVYRPAQPPAPPAPGGAPAAKAPVAKAPVLQAPQLQAPQLQAPQLQATQLQATQLQASPTATGHQLNGPSVAPSGGPTEVLPPVRKRRRRLALLAGAGLAVAAVSGALAWGISQHNSLVQAQQEAMAGQSAMGSLNTDLNAQAARYRQLHKAMASFMTQFQDNKVLLTKADRQLVSAQDQLAAAQSQVTQAQSQLDDTQANLTTTQSHATNCQVSSSLGQQTVQILASVNLSEINYLNAAQGKDVRDMKADLSQMQQLLSEEQQLGPRFSSALKACARS